MANSTYRLLYSKNAALFFAVNGASPKRCPEHNPCAHIESFSQGGGEPEYIKKQSRSRRGKFVKVGKTKTDVEDVTFTIESTLDLAGVDIGKYVKNQCELDVIINYSSCTRPDELDGADYYTIFEDVSLSNFSRSDVGTGEPDNNTPVTESVDASAGDYYNVFGLNVSSLSLRDLLALPDFVPGCVSVYGTEDCGEGSGCNEVFPGCETIFAGGMSGTDHVVGYTITNGSVWDYANISGIPNTSPPLCAVAGRNYYVGQAGSAAGVSEVYCISLEQIVYGISPTATLALSVAGQITSITENSDGQLIVTTDSGSVTILSGQNVVSTNNLPNVITGAVSGKDCRSMLAFTDTNELYATNNGGNTWNHVENVPGNTITTGYFLQDKINTSNSGQQFVVSTDEGMFCTTDCGCNWEKVNSCDNVTPTKVVCVTKLVQFAVGITPSGEGRIMKTISNGCSWECLNGGPGKGLCFVQDATVQPEYTCIDICEGNPNMFVAVDAEGNIYTGVPT